MSARDSILLMPGSSSWPLVVTNRNEGYRPRDSAPPCYSSIGPSKAAIAAS